MRSTTTFLRTRAGCTNLAMLSAVSSSPPDLSITETMPASSAPVRGSGGARPSAAVASAAVNCASKSVHGIGNVVAFPRAAMRTSLPPVSTSKARSFRYRFSSVKHTIDAMQTDAQIISNTVTLPPKSSSGE
eukprot:1988653-Pyramimonas_sp.AAC.1